MHKMEQEFLKLVGLLSNEIENTSDNPIFMIFHCDRVSSVRVRVECSVSSAPCRAPRSKKRGCIVIRNTDADA